MLLLTRLAGSDQRNRRVVLSDWSVDWEPSARTSPDRDRSHAESIRCRLVKEERRVRFALNKIRRTNTLYRDIQNQRTDYYDQDLARNEEETSNSYQCDYGNEPLGVSDI